MDDDIQFLGSRPAQNKQVSSQRVATGIALHVTQPGASSYGIVFRRTLTSVVHIGRRSGSETDYNTDDTPPGRALFRCAVVSRRHARIAFSDSGLVYLIDLKSHHGTHLQRDGITRTLTPEVPALLIDGDIVTFGKSVGRGSNSVSPVVARVEILYPGNNASGSSRNGERGRGVKPLVVPDSPARSSKDVPSPVQDQNKASSSNSLPVTPKKPSNPLMNSHVYVNPSITSLARTPNATPSYRASKRPRFGSASGRYGLHAASSSQDSSIEESDEEIQFLRSHKKAASKSIDSDIEVVEDKEDADMDIESADSDVEEIRKGDVITSATEASPKTNAQDSGPNGKAVAAHDGDFDSYGNQISRSYEGESSLCEQSTSSNISVSSDDSSSISSVSSSASSAVSISPEVPELCPPSLHVLPESSTDTGEQRQLHTPAASPGPERITLSESEDFTDADFAFFDKQPACILSSAAISTDKDGEMGVGHEETAKPDDPSDEGNSYPTSSQSNLNNLPFLFNANTNLPFANTNISINITNPNTPPTDSAQQQQQQTSSTGLGRAFEALRRLLPPAVTPPTPRFMRQVPISPLTTPSPAAQPQPDSVPLPSSPVLPYPGAPFPGSPFKPTTSTETILSSTTSTATPAPLSLPTQTLLNLPFLVRQELNQITQGITTNGLNKSQEGEGHVTKPELVSPENQVEKGNATTDDSINGVTSKEVQVQADNGDNHDDVDAEGEDVTDGDDLYGDYSRSTSPMDLASPSPPPFDASLPLSSVVDSQSQHASLLQEDGRDASRTGNEEIFNPNSNDNMDVTVNDITNNSSGTPNDPGITTNLPNLLVPPPIFSPFMLGGSRSSSSANLCNSHPLLSYPPMIMHPVQDHQRTVVPHPPPFSSKHSFSPPYRRPPCSRPVFSSSLPGFTTSFQHFFTSLPPITRGYRMPSGDGDSGNSGVNLNAAANTNNDADPGPNVGTQADSGASATVDDVVPVPSVSNVVLPPIDVPESSNNASEPEPGPATSSSQQNENPPNAETEHDTHDQVVQRLEDSLLTLQDEIDRLQHHRRRYRARFNANVHTIQGKLTSFDDRLRRLDDQVGAHDDRLNDSELQLAAVDGRIQGANDSRIALYSVEGRVSEAEDRLDELDGRVDEMDARVGDHDGCMVDFEVRLMSLERQERTRGLSNEDDEDTNMNERIQMDLGVIDGRVDELESQLQDVKQHLQTLLDDTPSVGSGIAAVDMKLQDLRVDLDAKLTETNNKISTSNLQMSGIGSRMATASNNRMRSIEDKLVCNESVVKEQSRGLEEMRGDMDVLKSQIVKLQETAVATTATSGVVETAVSTPIFTEQQPLSLLETEEVKSTITELRALANEMRTRIAAFDAATSSMSGASNESSSSTNSHLKRKRDSDDEGVSEERFDLADLQIDISDGVTDARMEDATDVVPPLRPNKPDVPSPRKRIRRFAVVATQTVAAVTIGAVAAWSALAFS